MMSPYLRAFLLGTLPFVSSGLALAESDPQNTPNDLYSLSLSELGQVEISIATGNSTPLDKAPATASVIYAAEIEATGARSLNDVLEMVPGLHVSLSSLNRLDSVYSMRGVHTGFNAQVLLLLNGIPIQVSLQGGRPILFRLLASGIDRVEVIRGPGSAIYGADAFAGVINVITKDAAAIEGTQLGVRTGSFSSHDFWLQSATKWQNWGVAFNLAYQESDGDNSRKISADLQSAIDSELGTDASRAPGALSTRYKVLDARLTLNSEKIQFNLWSWLSTDAGVGAGGTQALDPEGGDDSKLFLADMTYHFTPSSDIWDHSARLSYFYYDEEAHYTLMPAGSILPIGSDGNLDFADPSAIVQFPDGLIGKPGGIAKDSQLDLISIYTGLDSHRLRLATGVRRQLLNTRESKNFGPGVIDGTESVVDGSLTDVSDTPFVYLADRSRTVRYLSLQDEWQILSDLMLTTGVRYDDYSDFGGTTNPRMALVWGTNEKLTTKLLYGSAFRAPSFSEQHFKNNPISLGNPQINAEHIDTLELSFNYRITTSLQTTLTLFGYQARDMIEFIADEGATTSTAQNARDQDGEGLEWEVNWKPARNLRISGSYSLQKTEYSSSNAVVADAPGQQFKLNSNWEFHPNWSVNSQIYWVGDRRRATDDLRPDIDDYTLVNFTLRRKDISPDLNISLSLRNATDADAREPSSGAIAEDYPLESRSMWLALEYVFK